MPSERPSAKALAILTVIESKSHKGMFIFKTDLTLDGRDLDSKLQLPVKQMMPEDYVINVIPTLGVLFEVEDFYVRGDDYAGISTGGTDDRRYSEPD